MERKEGRREGRERVIVRAEERERERERDWLLEVLKWSKEEDKLDPGSLLQARG